MRAETPRSEIDELRTRLDEAEETLRAIRAGEVDAVLVQGENGEQVYTLRNADQPYRVLVEQMQEGAAILTVDGDVLYCNRRFAELAAVPLEAVVGRSVYRFVAGEDREPFTALLHEGRGARRGRLLAGDGRLRDVYVSVTASVSDGVERRSLIIADLSELVDARTARERAERENRAKDEFLAILAHELRNPIGAIAGAEQLLALVGHSEGPDVRAREVIGRQVKHLSRLIDDLLEAGRVVTGKITLCRSPVDLAELVRRSIAAAGGAHSVDRHIDVAAEPIWVEADVTRLEQIVANLLANAVKYTRPGGRIRVRVSADGDEALLRVEDDGIGIEPDLLARIFDPFIQGDRTLERARGGLGIGLTLVRRLVELHGGTIAAASEGPGRGSRFTVRLPRLPAPVDAPALTDERRSGARRRLLIVENHDDAREMYRIGLELVGHEVLEARDGLQGLELLKSARPDLALVDIGLPGLDGYELASRFRAEPGSERVLLVALTGYGSPDDRERSRQAGFDHHLVKPVQIDALQELVSRLEKSS